MKRALASLLLAAATAAAPGAGSAAPGGSVLGSKHDLSVTGPGPIRATQERNPCVFCHVPHAGVQGLSNRPAPKGQYAPYQSSTMASRAERPTGASRICLSCHDGTIAVGETATRTIPTVGGAISPDRASYIGTDLRSSHPVSFVPARSARTHGPPQGDRVAVDRSGEVQCTSCHDPHRERGDPLVGKFLVKPTERAELCLSCHDSLATGAPGTSHASATASFGPREGNAAGFASVGAAGCLACHASHHGDGKGRLLDRRDGGEDGICLRCHGASPVGRSVSADLSKPYAHAAVGRGAHDAAEGRAASARSLPETSPGTPRHVACVDCHEPHRASDRAASPSRVSGALDGVWGIDRNGQRVEQVQFEYEVCFKCHGDSANQTKLAAPNRPTRAGADPDLRRVFAADAPSYHPVLFPGRNPRVPSLRPPYTASSIIGCGDCHASDTGPGAGGGGLRGPHGSIYPALLERNYETGDLTPEGPSAYALCYKCHDRDKLLAESTFPEHARHLGPLVSAPCSACHAAHGVSARAGTPTENAHLVDFDVRIVKPFGGIRQYVSAGPGAGSCTLSCHGTGRTWDHASSAYSVNAALLRFRPISGRAGRAGIVPPGGTVR